MPIIKQRKLPPETLCQWQKPYLIIPMDCTVEDLEQILATFKRMVTA